MLPRSAGGDMSDVSLDRQITCVRREISMRRSVYPRWVKDGRMSEAAADMEIRCMEAVLRTLNDMKLLKGIDNPEE